VDTIYKKLAEHLNRLPVPFPATDTGVELKILERWFSEQEAGIALNMKGYPEPVSKIAQRLDMTENELAPVLMDMSKRGLLFRISKNGPLYMIVPLAEGMWEFQVNSINKEDIANLHEYMDFYMENGWYSTKTTQHRIIPISESIPADMEIYSYDQAEEIIKSQSIISVAECICRKEHEMIGQGCNHPKEVCMAFGTGAHFYLENGLGREVTRKEALEILHMAMDAGLVLQPGNGQKVWSMCMCCSCACYLLKSIRKMEDAFIFDDTATVNPERCIGCGVCIGSCEFDAIQIHQKEKDAQYLPPRDRVHMQMKIGEERGLL
jgi:Pyruvate/2-oxoacid:ferredoxin oxidoreductase delta subunit